MNAQIIIQLIFSLLIPIGVILFILLILREVALWYWKVNLIVRNQQEANHFQEESNKLLVQQNELLKQNNVILKQFVDDFMNK